MHNEAHDQVNVQESLTSWNFVAIYASESILDRVSTKMTKTGQKNELKLEYIGSKIVLETDYSRRD